jgi:hypothetical protein
MFEAVVDVAHLMPPACVGNLVSGGFPTLCRDGDLGAVSRGIQVLHGVVEFHVEKRTFPESAGMKALEKPANPQAVDSGSRGR